MKPTWIVGIAPVVRGDPPWHPATDSGRRLRSLAGREDVERAYSLANLLDYPVSDLDTRETRALLSEAAAGFVLYADSRYILAGTEVVRAFGKRVRPRKTITDWHTDGPPVLSWYLSRSGVWCSILPHPSGMNRWYNYPPQRRQAAAAFLRACAFEDHQLSSPTL